MSEVKLIVQSTPNPNALKFVINRQVRSEGNVTYKNAGECDFNPLAKALFELSGHIKEVYFFDNYITVTQDGLGDWDELEEKIRQVITTLAPTHDPNFKFEPPVKKQAAPTASSPDIDRINSILDETVRPALQMDGGDIQVVDYANNTVKVFYQGACGSCPSSTMGTMKAIENILRDQFNPEVNVEVAETF